MRETMNRNSKRRRHEMIAPHAMNYGVLLAFLFLLGCLVLLLVSLYAYGQ